MSNDQQGKVWAMSPRHVEACSVEGRARAAEGNKARAEMLKAWGGSVAAFAADMGAKPYDVIGCVAVVPVSGPLWFEGAASWHSSHCWLPGALAMAASDPAVKHLVLDVNCPGGDVHGMSDLVDAVRRARAALEATGGSVVSLVRDMACSGGYWLACQASRMVATRTASVGSIGVYAAINDTSEMARAEGVTVHVVKSGEFKGVGLFGVAVGAAALTEVGRQVAAAAGLFVADVAAGRARAGLSLAAVSVLADGREYHAAEAVEAKLIDGIMGFEQLVGELNASTNKSASGFAAARPVAVNNKRAVGNKGAAMAAVTLDDLNKMDGGPELLKEIQDAAVAAYEAKPAEEVVPEPAKAATLGELRAAMPEAGDGELLKALEGGYSFDRALARAGDLIKAELAVTKAALMKANEAAATAKAVAAKVAGGVVPTGVSDDAVSGGAETAEGYLAQAGQIAADRKIPFAMALAAAAMVNRVGHAAWLANKMK